jgi:hypothetical protein
MAPLAPCFSGSKRQGGQRRKGRQARSHEISEFEEQG